MELGGVWIWAEGGDRRRWNEWVGFRKRFHVKRKPGRAMLGITADAEYRVWVNGTWVGQGPARGFPDRWNYEVWDVKELLRQGDNVIAIAGHSVGVSTFKYILADAGVRAGLSLGGGESVGTDSSWKCKRDIFGPTKHLRSACQMGWLEPLRTANDLAWTRPGFDDSNWETAAAVSEFRSLQRCDVRVEAVGTVHGRAVSPPHPVSPPQTSWAVSLRSALLPGYVQAAPQEIRGVLAIPFHVKQPGSVKFEFAKDWFWVSPRVKLNEIELERVGSSRTPRENGAAFEGVAREGANILCLDVQGHFHEWTVALSVDSVKLTPGDEFLVVGPNDEDEHAELWRHPSIERLLAAKRLTRMNSKTDPAIDLAWPFGMTAYAARSENGTELQTVFDLGRMSVGYWELEYESDERSTAVLNGFEAYQGGTPDFAWEMANTMQVDLPPGKGTIRSLVRRGARFLLAQSPKAKIAAVRVHEATCPSVLAAPFHCSDPLLNRIFEMCALTQRLCSEDTFVDCPTYEQTFWVGDSRIECLVNYALYGGYDLGKRCLSLAAESLGRSQFVESHVPSGWQTIIPAWSSLWAMAVEDSLSYFTDDRFLAGMKDALVYQLEAIEQHVDERNLFAINAWNLTDWSGMDQPNEGVTTANQAWISMAARATNRICQKFGDTENSKRCEEIIVRLTDGANRHLWDESKQAFSDCIDPRTGRPSSTVSQQTHCLMALSGTASGERYERSVSIATGNIELEGCVKVGTPYFYFFILELMSRLGHEEETIAVIRDKWGPMIEQDSTTCWELFPGYMPGGRNTRSYCHAWSTAPAFFLIRNQLGLSPIRPDLYRFAPVPSGLTHCSGSHQTPWGPIFASWKLGESGFEYEVRPPAGVTVDVDLSRAVRVV